MIEERVPLGTICYLGSPLVVLDNFCFAFANLVQYNNEFVCGPDQFIHLERSISTDRSMSRNVLCSKFLGDWILMLDADHKFEPDLVHRMLMLFESQDLDVLTGVYVSKNPPYPPILHVWDPVKNGWYFISEWSPKARLIEIGRGGAGCLMIRRRVLERIYKELGEEPFAYNNNFSEDFSFYTRLQQLGIKAHAACQINCEHMLLTSVSVDTFRKQDVQQYTPDNPVPTAFVEQMCGAPA